MTKKKTPDPKPTPAERPMAIDKTATLAGIPSGAARVLTALSAKADAFVSEIAEVVTAHAERDVALCPICGGSRAGLAANEPCKVDGHQLEDS